MPQFIVSYDLTSTGANAHNTFKRRAQERQWSDRITLADSRLAALPDTTLWGVFDNMAAAENALEAARSAAESDLGAPVRLPRSIIAQTLATSTSSNDIVPQLRGLGAALFGR